MKTEFEMLKEKFDAGWSTKCEKDYVGNHHWVKGGIQIDIDTLTALSVFVCDCCQKFLVRPHEYLNK